MDTLLVISKEPALAETLASELAEFVITQTLPDKAAAFLQKDFSLIICDDVTIDALLSEAKAPVVKLTRPARLSDLLYTIRSKLQSKTAPETILLSKRYILSPSQRLLSSTDGNQQIFLTEKELELLLCLLEHKDKPIARDALLKRVWGYNDDIATHTLETHIYRLRSKLAQTEGGLDIVFSEDGGYHISCA